MESSHTSPKRIDLTAFCETLLNDSVQLKKYIDILNSNPDWIEDNCVDDIDVAILLKLIDVSYVNKSYRTVLHGVVDVLRAEFITNEVFTKLVNFPDDEQKIIRTQLSHKKLSETQLLYLCQFETDFECYFELAILYYENSQISFAKFKDFIKRFKNSKFSYLYEDLLEELSVCQSSSTQKEKWIFTQMAQ